MYTITQFALYLLLALPLIGAYAILALGTVVVFRASRVLNLAHGAMAVLPAYVVYAASEHGLPLVVAVPLGIAAGAGLGAAIERLFVRPLARQGPTAQTVGTVAVYGLVVAGVAQGFGSGSLRAPNLFPAGGPTVSGTLLAWGALGLFVVSLAVAAACLALFRYTRVGLWMRGAAENPTAAALMGINPQRMARFAWLLGGALAGLAGVLLAPVTSLNPYSLSLQMLPAFVAALIGGLDSLVGAVVGAAVVGAAQGLVPAFALVPGLRSLADQVGMPQLVLTVLALVVMYRRGQRFSVAEGTGSITTGGAPTRPRSTFDPALAPVRTGRRRLFLLALLAALVAWPFIQLPSILQVTTFSLLGDAITAGGYFLVAASLVMLTGWVGQISLAQASFVGIAAFATAKLASATGIGFPVSLLITAVLSGAICAGLGVVALRVRGLYLAVATLIFAWMADSYLFIVPWFGGVGGSTSVTTHAVGVAGGFPFFDVTDRKTGYFLLLAAAASVLFGLLNLRDSKTGRALGAIRGSETAAASLGVDVVRTKLFAFALAGFIAGIGGNLAITQQVTIVPAEFSLSVSLLFLAIAVVGGLRSLGGAIASACLFAGLNEVFFRVPALGRYLQLVSALLLA
ncbi:MAG: ABC transporter permease, partial [Mycobacteriales bacterium]